MSTGEQGQSRDGILVDPHQSGGLTSTAAVGEVLEDRQHLVMWELGVEQRGPLELREAGLASAAVQQPVLGLAVVTADGQVAGTPSAGVGTVGILAAEAVEVIRG